MRSLNYCTVVISSDSEFQVGQQKRHAAEPGQKFLADRLTNIGKCTWDFRARIFQSFIP